MKGIICYYSGSGNTRLAVEHLKKRVSNAEFDLFNIVKNVAPDFSAYRVAGFAAFADFGAPSQIFYDFFGKLQNVNRMPAFVLNTYGFMSLRTLSELGRLAVAKGFDVISGYSLHTPENYPPMRKSGKGFDHAPDEKEIKGFHDYIDALNFQMKVIESGKIPEKMKLKQGILGSIIPLMPRKQAKKDFGIQDVRKDLCTECGLCKKVCPYEAVTLSPKPLFDHEKCWGCWACYNHCPQKAICTPKFNGEFQYAKPVQELADKLGR